MNRKLVEKEVGSEAVLGSRRMCGRRASEGRDDPEIDADPAFWLKGVSNSSDERG